MPWNFYLLEFFSGLFLANGVPHFVQGICGHRFQTPFATPPGVGESSPVVNVLWGFANLLTGILLLKFYLPNGPTAIFGWVVFGGGILLLSVMTAYRFGIVRSRTR
jgi:hypothetical protein